MLFKFSDYQLAQLRGKIQYKHLDENYSAAYELGENASLTLTVPRYFGASDVILEMFSEDLKNKLASYTLVWQDLSFDNDIYSLDLDIESLGVGLYFFRITLLSRLGNVYCYPLFDEIHFSNSPDNIDYFQLTVSDFKYSKPTSKYGGIIYHIFVDRFAKGGSAECKTDAILVDDWSNGIPEYPDYPGAPLKNNTFYGGTLYGIIEKLDYIESLGVNTIYLSPIFSSPSNHKYDTSDYMSVDCMFGSDEALKLLISKAKDRGIGIVLDGVFNHTGADSIYFNKFSNYASLGAYQSKASQYYEWYDFKSYPDNYTCWWGIDILPRINTTIPNCRDFFVGKDGVIEKYASMGIDGFRLDVADELDDTFISMIKDKLNDQNTRSILYGEVWEDASNKIAYGIRKKYYLGAELDGVMNYPLRKGLIDYITSSKIYTLKYALTTVITNAPKRITDIQMNLLGTHDTERILTILGDEPSNSLPNSVLVSKRLEKHHRKLAITRLKMAYTVLATLPGIPSIYYGDEAGLEGYSDPFNRLPYPWHNEQLDLIEHYRIIGNIRKNNSVYREGAFSLIYLDSNVLIFSRVDEVNTYLTVMNNSSQKIDISFDLHYEKLISNESKSANYVDTVQELSTEIYKLKRGALLTLFY